MEAPLILEPEDFASFGCYVRRGFLDARHCSRLRRLMEAAPRQAGQIFVRGRSTLARKKRDVSVLTMDARIREGVDRAFQDLMPALGKHFGKRLSGHEDVQYLRYPEGGHYGLHTDRTPGTRDPKVRKRKVSVIVFLSRTGLGPGEHVGGELVFPWSDPGKPRKRHPLAIRSEPGLLVAFDPGSEHEVRPVLGGFRYSLASWYF